MKRAVIVHGWEGSPERDWMPWLKGELEKEGFEVLVPEMPDTDDPEFHAWLGHLSRTVGEPDEQTFLVGHSLGCITILRYLESLGQGRVGGAVLVAGFTDDLGYEEIGSFFQEPIDWDGILKRTARFIAIHSDDDPHVPLRHADVFKDKLGAEVIVKSKAGHFSGDDGCTEFPDALEAVLRLSA